MSRAMCLEGFSRHERLGERLRNQGVCADVLRVVLAAHTLVTGEVVLQELGRVLRRRIDLPPGAVKEIDEFLRPPLPSVSLTLEGFGTSSARTGNSLSRSVQRARISGAQRGVCMREWCHPCPRTVLLPMSPTAQTASSGWP